MCSGKSSAGCGGVGPRSGKVAPREQVAGLVKLRSAVQAMPPAGDLPGLLLEPHAWSWFLDEHAQMSRGVHPDGDLRVTVVTPRTP